jgi:acetolactate synthase-1/2/3 large subunit
MFGLPQTDVLIAAGLRFNWLLMSGSLIPAATKVVRIDIDPHEIDRNRMADAGLVGDVGSVLVQLTPLADKKDHSAWSETLKAAGRSLLDYELRIRETATAPIHPVRLVAQIQKVVGDDTVFVTDGGDTNYFGLAFETRQKAASSPPPRLFGCLGTAFLRMAAKLARPDKKWWCSTATVVRFQRMEFDTMVRHNIPSGGHQQRLRWGMIKHSQELSIGADRLQCAELGVRHYEKVVEGLGGHGEFVTKDEEIIPALERAFASGKPACVNVMTDPTVTSPATPLFYQALKME